MPSPFPLSALRRLRPSFEIPRSLRAVAQFGATRAPALPEAPTLRELGVNLTLGVDLGLFAPAGTPAPIVSRINDAVARVVGSEEFQGFATKALARAAYLPADEYVKVVEGERALYSRIVPRIKLGDK